MVNKYANQYIARGRLISIEVVGGCNGREEAIELYYFNDNNQMSQFHIPKTILRYDTRQLLAKEITYLQSLGKEALNGLEVALFVNPQKTLLLNGIRPMEGLEEALLGEVIELTKKQDVLAQWVSLSYLLNKKA